MDQSIPRLPDPAQQPLRRERRRAVRQKLHTPVYASFNGPQSGMVVDLSELLDLHEDGFAVQTAIRPGGPLEVNRSITLSLDLPETRSFIHGSGQVIWNDETGRAGIRFTFLPDPSRHILKQWLFTNLLVASTNYAARSLQLAQRQLEESSGLGHAEQDTNLRAAFPPAEIAPEQVLFEAALDEPLFATQSLLEESASDAILTEQKSQTKASAGHVSTLYAALQVASSSVAPAAEKLKEERLPDLPSLDQIAERAMVLTGATGSALALFSGDNMVCRASVGDPAPPKGSTVDLDEGLSGNCVRSGQLVVCDDTEVDHRVDPTICRSLGIGSFMAVPIFADFRVVGLLEVFSPIPHAFSEDQGVILERLLEMVPAQPSVPEPGPVNPESELFPNLADQIIPHEATSASVGSEHEDSFGMHSVREALWETAPPASENSSRRGRLAPTIPPAAEKTAEERAPSLSASPRTRSRVSYFGYLATSIAVVALVLGYLLAPFIEKRLGGTGQMQSAQAASSVSPVAWQVAAGGKPQVLSLTDLRNLAGQGDADAQYQMGILFHNGEGVAQDDSQAVQWFERAANQGYVRAQSTLGAYYWAGRGVPPDFTRAYFWSELALAQGDEGSKSRLEGLAAQMTQSQVATARQQAEAWLQSHNQPAKSKPSTN